MRRQFILPVLGAAALTLIVPAGATGLGLNVTVKSASVVQVPIRWPDRTRG